MKRLLLGVLCGGLLMASSTWAMPDGKREALSVVGQVFAAQKMCTLIEFDIMAMGAIYVRYDIDLDRAHEYGVVYAKAEETIKAWRGRMMEEICIGALMLYGPQGEHIPGLLKMK